MNPAQNNSDGFDEETIDWMAWLREVAAGWKVLLGGTLLAGALAAAVSLLLTPIYTARTSLLPPQSAQTLPGAALAALGPLAAIAAGSTKSPVEQYVALMRSETISNRIIEAYDLMSLYAAKYREDARRMLGKRVRISVGRKDGLIVVEVDDVSPERAAKMANRYVDELRRLTNDLALTEAQQRRQFFEAQRESTRLKLESAQATLQASGFSQGALRAEPRATAESYARLRAETDAAEVRLRVMRITLADGALEVQQQLGVISALRARLAAAERSSSAADDDAGYLASFREFKYQEALFELFSRQFELARVDEAREGGLIQVVDPAQPPERRSWPRRTLIVAAAMAVALVALLALLTIRRAMRDPVDSPAQSVVR